MRVKHVLECQFTRWVEVWGKLSIESKVIDLEPAFVEWLVHGKFITSTVRSSVEEYEDCDSAFSNAEVEEMEGSPSSAMVGY